MRIQASRTLGGPLMDLEDERDKAGANALALSEAIGVSDYK